MTDRMDIRKELTDFYRIHNPAKLRDVDGLLVTFKGRERALLRALHLKYRTASVDAAGAVRESAQEAILSGSHAASVASTTPGTPTHTSMPARGNAGSYQSPAASPDDPIDAMRLLLDQMTAIDLTTLAVRLPNGPDTAATQAPLLTHTIRYLQHFLSCAKDFAQLARHTVDAATATSATTARAATKTIGAAATTKTSHGTQTDAHAEQHDAVTQTTASTATQTNQQAPHVIPVATAAATERVTSVAVQTDTRSGLAQPPLRPVPTLPPREGDTSVYNTIATVARGNEEDRQDKSDTAVRHALRPLGTPSPLLKLPRSRQPCATSTLSSSAVSAPSLMSPSSSMMMMPAGLSTRASRLVSREQRRVTRYEACPADTATRVYTFAPSPVPGAGVIGPALRSGAVRLCPGDTLVLRAGTYYENISLDCCGECTLTSEFAGAAVVLRPAIHTEPVLSVRGPACHLRVVNINISGDHTACSGDDREYSRAVAGQSESRDDEDDGVVRGSSSSAASLVMAQAGARISLRGCDMGGAASAAVVAAEDGTVVRLWQCRLTRCGLSAVYARRAARVELHECRVTHCAVGICAAQRASVSLEQCRVEASETDGLVLLDAATATLARTMIAHSGSNGVLVSADAELWLLQCIVEANGMYGVQRFQGARVHLADSTLRANGLLDLSEETPQLLPQSSPSQRSITASSIL